MPRLSLIAWGRKRLYLGLWNNGKWFRVCLFVVLYNMCVFLKGGLVLPPVSVGSNLWGLDECDDGRAYFLDQTGAMVCHTAVIILCRYS